MQLNEEIKQEKQKESILTSEFIKNNYDYLFLDDSLESIIEYLTKIPSDKYKEFCLESKHDKSFIEQSFFYRILANSFVGHYIYNANISNYIKNTTNIIITKELEQVIEYHITLYDIFKFGWNDVKDIFDNVYIDSISYKPINFNCNVSQKSIKYNLENPSRAFKFIMYLNATHDFLECYEINKISNITLWKDYNYNSKLIEKIAKNEELNIKDEKFWQKLKNRYKTSDRKLFKAGYCLINICLDKWRNSKKSIVRSYSDALSNTSCFYIDGDLERELLKELRKSAKS